MIYNIDVINKLVSKKLNIDEQTIKKVNNFYWSKVNKHIVEFNDQPINLMHIGYIRTSKLLIRNKIKAIIKKLRNFKNHNKEELSPRALKALSNWEKKFKKLWHLRNNTEYILKDE